MMDGRNDASSVSQSQGTLSPRELDQDSLTETESSVHLPNQKKLPSLDELDKNFVELDRVPDAYADPVQVHQMLIDERMSANKRQLEFQRLNEELNRLHNQLDEVQERHREQADANLTLTQSEKDEITRLNKELSSTKAQLAQVQSEPIIIEKMLPSDVELVRAEVLNENRTKFSLDSLAQIEAEVDKYRQLYNDARSRLTILTGDFEHAKLEHQDEIDQMNYRFKVEMSDARSNVEHYKKQLEEVKAYANDEIDRLRNELEARQARIESLQIENEELAERHQQFVRQVDESRASDQTRLADAQTALTVERANIERNQTVIENREAEITDLTKQLALQTSEVEKGKRQIEDMRREQDDVQLKCQNQLSMQKKSV